MSVDPDLVALLKELEQLDRSKTFRKIEYFEPYPKQRAFIALGKKKRERLLIAANQIGKSETGAYETACHLTGIYPKDWPGRQWKRPVKFWAAGETSLLARDVQQKKLCGEPGVDDQFGSGMIPKELFHGEPTKSRGVADAYDTIQIKRADHSGGISVLRFKSYEQGRKKFQGETLDGIWFDEEPPMDVYQEGLTRTTATKGMVFVTFTPLLGRSDVVLRFTEESSPDRASVNMTIDDAKHISVEERDKIVAGYLPHEREARAKGVPILGSGRIFLSTEESISEDRLEYVPAYWPKLWGIDFGIEHHFGAVLIIWDRDNDIIHVHTAIKMSDSLPIQHAAAIKLVGGDVPVAWPHDGTQRDKGSGEQLKNIYKAHGLRMLPDHATWPDGGFATEPGILEMDERFKSGRLRFARHLNELFEEYRFFHRKDGQIVKIKDDLLSALRIAIMMKRSAKLVALGNATNRRKRQNDGLATGIDFDVFA